MFILFGNSGKYLIMHLKIILLLLAALFNIVCSVSEHPVFLVISFDGFRYNYFSKNVTPTLERLKTKGTHAKYMRNVFVTKTFPNHHSIATGLYAEVHGVMANTCYDSKYKNVLKYGYELWHYDNNTIPIWILNEKCGQGRHSGVYMWPGSDFQYQNITPTFQVQYNHSEDWKIGVDTVLNWFTNPTTPANFVMMYFDEPDYQSHKYGPESEPVEKQIENIDNIICYLHQSILERNLSNVINVVLLSDHGMVTVTPARIINITEYMDNSTYLLAGSSPALHIIPNEGHEDELYTILKNVSQHMNFTVYRRNDLLERWHYKHNRRTPPLMLLADEGYGFDDLYKQAVKYSLEIKENTTFGVHGYDNALPNMHPFFMAWGPLIKRNHTIEVFDSVDLYSLFSKVLGLSPPPTNGSFAHVKDMLRDQSNTVSPLFIKVAGIILVSMLLMGIAGCVTIQILKLWQCRGSCTQAYKILDPRRPDWKESTLNGSEHEIQYLLDNTELEDT